LSFTVNDANSKDFSSPPNDLGSVKKETAKDFPRKDSSKETANPAAKKPSGTTAQREAESEAVRKTRKGVRVISPLWAGFQSILILFHWGVRKKVAVKKSACPPVIFAYKGLAEGLT